MLTLLSLPFFIFESLYFGYPGVGRFARFILGIYVIVPLLLLLTVLLYFSEVEKSRTIRLLLLIVSTVLTLVVLLMGWLWLLMV